LFLIGTSTVIHPPPPPPAELDQALQSGFYPETTDSRKYSITSTVIIPIVGKKK
jgi:hypothetical protein